MLKLFSLLLPMPGAVCFITLPFHSDKLLFLVSEDRIRLDKSVCQSDITSLAGITT